ncbi:MAG: hypothetical protein KAH38_03820 [Candidatus Hydrogenedentes bacterium]|nr:hypothetical protein [Candidatus Hydrogenedentota bacterium]
MLKKSPSPKVAMKSLLGDASSFLVSSRFLRTRLLVYSVARFGVVVAIIAGAWFAPHVVGIEHLPVMGLHILAACLFMVNLVVFSILYWGSWDKKKSYLHLMLVMHVTVSIDFVFLTVALWLVGGAASPFISFYILNIILAAMLLPREGVFFQALFAYFLFSGLVLSQWLELAPIFNPVGATVADAPINGRYAITVLTVQAILFTGTTLLVSEISTALKRGERALSSLTTELEKLAEMRRDFLHVVTHNLKAPAAAATMLLESVEMLWLQDASKGARTAIARARVRTQELGELVQDLQQLTALESGALHEQEQPVSLNEIVQKLAESHSDSLSQKKQKLELTIDETLPDIQAVPRLIQEAAANYLSNAIKYTPEEGHIFMRTRQEDAMAIFEVEDTGVGIPPEFVDNLFGEFVRAPATVSGKRPPGIGLGLSIVKRIMEYYDGRVYVSSELDKGSIFSFALPFTRSAPEE